MTKDNTELSESQSDACVPSEGSKASLVVLLRDMDYFHELLMLHMINKPHPFGAWQKRNAMRLRSRSL